MEAHSLVLLKVLANRFHTGYVPNFCHPLPAELAEAVTALDIDSEDPSFAWCTPKQWLERFHYSWLAPVVTTFPSALQPSLLACLTPQQSAGLSELLNIQETVPPPTEIAGQFLRRSLYEALQLGNVTPLELVPQTPFKVLCSWDKTQLVKLIDYLSMYDLKEKIRHIVERKRLHDIYTCLDKGQLEFLRNCLHQKERLVSTALSLERWQGDKQGLQHLLHRRGLIRLGSALCGQPEAVVWYITHTLDTGRSNAIMRHCYSALDPHIVQLLAQQVSNLIEYLDPKKRREEK